MALNDAVPSSATDVFKRNAEDADRLLNSTGDITTRTGKILPSWDEITKTHVAWNNRGAWVTATAYAVNDIWEDSGIWYVVLSVYTSGASAAADIAGPNIAVLNGNFGSAATRDTGTAFDQIPLNTDIVYPVESVQNIAGLIGIQDGQQISLKGWHPNSDTGGGILYWDAAKLKSEHNGGTIFSPTVPYSATTSDYLDGIGETDGAGFGCWVRRRDTDYIDVSFFGAVAGGVVDDTNSILRSVNIAASIKSDLYFLGDSYKITQNIVIPDNTIQRIKGNGTDNTKLRFNFVGEHLTIQSYYTRAVHLSDLTIIDDTDVSVSNANIGLNVDDGRWGIAVHAENVNIVNYTGIAWRIRSGYAYSGTKMEIRGRAGTRKGKALVLDGEVGEAFGGGGFFRNCVFHVHKIGIQNLFHAVVGFHSCTFENLSLFLNVKQAAGVSHHMNFESSWYELVDNGVINAAIDEDTLLPLLPVQNRAEIKRLEFNSAIQSGTTQWTTFVDSTVEPYYSQHYTPSRGLVLTDERNIRALTVVRTFASASSFVQNESMAELSFTPNAAYKKGYYTIAVEAENSTSDKMYAMYTSDGVKTYLNGDIEDPAGIGTTTKVNFTWSDSLNLTFRVYATDLVSVTARITFTEY